MALFIVVEALLLIFAVWQIVNNVELLLLVLFGILISILLCENHRDRDFKFSICTRWISYFFSLINSPALWVMAVFAVLFIGLKGVEISGIDLTKNAFWPKTNHYGSNRASEVPQ